jgi:hypothetical protein
MRSIGPWRWYINIIVTVLDIIHRTVFYLKRGFSETGFFFCLQVQDIQLATTKMSILCFRRQRLALSTSSIWVGSKWTRRHNPVSSFNLCRAKVFTCNNRFNSERDITCKNWAVSLSFSNGSATICAEIFSTCMSMMEFSFALCVTRQALWFQAIGTNGAGQGTSIVSIFLASSIA